MRISKASATAFNLLFWKNLGENDCRESRLEKDWNGAFRVVPTRRRCGSVNFRHEIRNSMHLGQVTFAAIACHIVKATFGHEVVPALDSAKGPDRCDRFVRKLLRVAAIVVAIVTAPHHLFLPFCPSHVDRRRSASRGAWSPASVAPSDRPVRTC